MVMLMVKIKDYKVTIFLLGLFIWLMATAILNDTLFYISVLVTVGSMVFGSIIMMEYYDNKDRKRDKMYR